MPILTKPISAESYQKRLTNVEEKGGCIYSRRDFKGAYSAMIPVPGRQKYCTVKNRGNIDYLYEIMYEYFGKIESIESYKVIPRSESMAIAKALGITHPKNSLNELIVITTDFYLIIREAGRLRHLAINVVTDDMYSRKERETADSYFKSHLDIQEEYYKRKSIEYIEVPQSAITEPKNTNIKMLILAAGNLTRAVKGEATSWFYKRYISSDLSVSDISRECCEKYRLPAGIGINIFSYLVCLKRIDIDLSKEPLMYSRPRDNVKSRIDEIMRKVNASMAPVIKVGNGQSTNVGRLISDAHAHDDLATAPLYKVLYKESDGYWIISADGDDLKMPWKVKKEIFIFCSEDERQIMGRRSGNRLESRWQQGLIDCGFLYDPKLICDRNYRNKIIRILSDDFLVDRMTVKRKILQLWQR